MWSDWQRAPGAAEKGRVIVWAVMSRESTQDTNPQLRGFQLHTSFLKRRISLTEISSKQTNKHTWPDCGFRLELFLSNSAARLRLWDGGITASDEGFKGRGHFAVSMVTRQEDLP